MTQDCLNSLSTTDVSKRLPKGINITGTDGKSVSGIEEVPWSYLFIHNKTAQAFEREIKDYNETPGLCPSLLYSSFFYIQAKEREWRG